MNAKAGQQKKLREAKKHTRIEDFVLRGTRMRMSPVGLWYYASDFLRAAKVAEPVADAPFSPAHHFLVCRALELSLKAFLSMRGRSLWDLARGHNLAVLLGGAERRRLADVIQLAPRQRREIRRASRYYAEKVFEYPALLPAFANYPKNPRVNLLIATADALVSALRQPCLRA